MSTASTNDDEYAFTEHGIKFWVTSSWRVICDDGLDLGSFDDCIAEGEVLRQLIELLL